MATFVAARLGDAARLRLRRVGALLSCTSLALGTFVFQQAAMPLAAHGFTAPSAVTDVNPNSLTAGNLFGGRTVNFAVNPINTQIVFAATEFGGLWKSTDHGSTWSHVDQVPLTAMEDVKIASSDVNLVIASGAYDGSFDNRGGGIWRSTDGGNTWAKATGTDFCSPLAANNGREIAIGPGTPGSLTVMVGTDCGIATSTNSGASWSLINPPGNNQIWDVKITKVGSALQVDACGDGGYVRSPDGGATWPTETDWGNATFPQPLLGSPPAPASPGDPCRVATAPNDPNTVFMAARSPVANPGDKIGETYQFESDDGGVNWHNLQVSIDGNGRDPSVLTFPAFDGVATHFEVFFATDQVIMHQTCDTANPQRCTDGTGANTATCNPPPGEGKSGNWDQWDGTIPHCATDPGDIAFDPNVGCPFLQGGDGGIFKTANATDGCNVGNPSYATFTQANTGLHALWVYQLAGSAVPSLSHTDIYYGMQDNGQNCSNDDAATFHQCGGADVFNTISPLSGPPVTVLKNQNGGFQLFQEDGTTATGWTSPPVPAGGGIDGVASFGASSFAFVIHDGSKPAVYSVQVTTNAGTSWAQMGPNLPGKTSGLPNGEQPIKASGPSSAPVFYLELTVAGTPTIYRLQGPLNGTATLSSASNGLISAYTYNVDPSNPLLLYAVDSSAFKAKSSTDGGQTWVADNGLTNASTLGNVYPFTTPAGPNINSFSFDPASNTILAGTQFSGIFASYDGGASWSQLPGSQQVPRVLQFFFDTRNQGTVYVGSQGRGAWKIHLPQADLSITKTHSPDPVVAGTQLTWKLTVTNSGPDAAPNVTVKDVLPAHDTYLTNNLNPPAGCAAFGQTVTCSVGDLAASQTVTFQIVTLVDSNAVSLAGGPTSITDNATVATSGANDPNLANNSASDTAIVNDLADLEVSKLCKPDTTVFAGTPIVCTVFVDNHGPSFARNVAIDDAILSSGTVAISSIAVAPGPTSCTTSTITGGHKITCNVGDLANASTSQTGRVTLSYTLTANDGQNIDDIASARSDTPDPDATNNQAEVNLTVTSLADLALTKVGPASVVAGNSISWTLTAHNNGPSSATNVLITDTVPAGVSITSVTMPGGTCQAGLPGDSSHPTTCAAGTLAAGATSSTMTINATVNPQTTGILHNDARVSSDTFDGNSANDLAHTDTTVVVQSHLTVTKAATPNPATAGTPLSYQITVGNTGPSTATAITLTDPLPSGLAFSSTGGVGVCGFQTNTNTVSCQLPNLDPGQSESVFVYTTVKASTPAGPMTNTASATGNGSPTGTGSVTTNVVTSADLTIVLTSDTLVYKPSTTIHYQITVTNNGPSDAQNVVITQALPGVKQGKYISNNIGCAAPVGTTLTCQAPAVPALATIPAGGSITFQVNFFITGNKGTITSNATVTSSTSDPVSSNNSSTRVVTVK
ncbi:MAG TPA: hypothetical protein VI384_06280 [Candidatus Dormibacteraeota bacterium]